MQTEVDILFREFSESDRTAFLALGKPVPFAADEVILPAGRSEWDVYIVQAGEVSVWVGNVRLADLREGQTLGTSAILVPQIQWSAVRGNTPGALLQISRDAVITFFQVRPSRLFEQFCVNLFRVWLEVLRQRNGRVAELQSQFLSLAPADRKRRFKLLIVDDEEGILNTLVEIFKERYDTVTARDGLTAVARAFSDKPDLILLDLGLPQVDGFQVAECLKSYPDTGHIPIVMVTALTTAPDRVKGMIYGADEYLTKPVDLDHLYQTVNRLLERVYG